jgi:cytochrome P450
MDSLNFLTFHRDNARHELFSNQKTRDPFFDPRTKAWIVTNPSDCRLLISSEKLRPATYAEDYRALSQRFNIDFSALVFAFSHIPLCQHGENHARSRRAASEFLATRRTVVAAQIPKITATHLSAFKREGELEVMSNIIEPMTQEYICLIAGIEIGAAQRLRHVSLIFDRSSGLSKRQAMEAEIAALRELIISRLGQDALEDEVGLRLAYFILGMDPLKGMLGESLHKIFESNAGRRLAEINYPDFPPETGVPFIERLVIRPFNFGNSTFNSGDRVRIFLQSFASEQSDLSRANFFGAGPHACLGRPLSVEIWKGVTSFLSEIQLRASVLSYAPRMSDYVFTCPDQLVLEIRA